MWHWWSGLVFESQLYLICAVPCWIAFGVVAWRAMAASQRATITDALVIVVGFTLAILLIAVWLPFVVYWRVTDGPDWDLEPELRRAVANRRLLQ